MDEDWRDEVMAAIGAASMCWEFPERAGVFDYQRAKALAEGLIETISRAHAPAGGTYVGSPGGEGRERPAEGDLAGRGKGKDSYPSAPQSLRSFGGPSPSAKKITTSSPDASKFTESGESERARGRRLPEDWWFSAELAEWARENVPELDLAWHTDQFRDYWLSETGTRAAKKRWDLTWKNWMRRAAERKNERGRARVRPSTADAKREALRELGRRGPRKEGPGELE